jgi:hypothetical protein
MIVYKLGQFHMRGRQVRFLSNLCGICVVKWHWDRSLYDNLNFSCHYQFMSVVYQCSILTFISMLLQSEEQSEKRGNLHTKLSFEAIKELFRAIYS